MSDEWTYDRTRLALQWVLRATILTAIFAAGLFVSAGTMGWSMGWIYLAALYVNQVIIGAILVPGNPQLAAERTRVDRDAARDWDRPLTGIVSLFGPLLTLIVAGLDHRLAWSPPLPEVLRGIGVVAGVAGLALGIWAMVTNRYFYSFVRIEPEHGHRVISAGPYRIVRHPGYAAGALYAVATPLWLNAWWAYVAAAVTVTAIVVRTALEDRVLRAELPGYDAYAQRVKHRLLPGLW
jgi:protein-S-isoprenylcysteine O-methyltransferase Ste14